MCPSCGARLVVTPGEAVSESTSPQAKGPVKTVAAPELDTLVDDLLVGELEQSLTPEELELTKAAVLDWLIEELEETMDPEAWAEATVGTVAERLEKLADPARRQALRDAPIFAVVPSIESIVVLGPRSESTKQWANHTVGPRLTSQGWERTGSVSLRPRQVESGSLGPSS